MITHRPGDPGYQQARKLFIGRQNEVLPAAVVECATEADVVAAMTHVRSNGLRFALRGGGHSFAEHSTSDGVVLDLAGLRDIEVRQDTVVVGAGVLVGALTDTLAGSARVTPVGWCRSVGVVGAVLGGGYGVLGRYYGLGADHLVSARVLLADGRIVRASADEEPDLCWALRGAGGGNFGVVLSVELRTRPAVPLVSVRATWPWERVVDVVDAWQRLAPAATKEMNVELSVYASDFPDEPAAIALFGVVVGSSADEVLGPFEALAGPPSSVTRTVLAAEEAARHCDYPGDAAEHVLPRLPPGERPGLRLARSEFFPGPLPRSAITAVTKHLAQQRLYGVYRDLELIPWGAALSADNGGAFAHRDARFLVKHTVQTGCRATDDTRAASTAWVNHSWGLTHRFGTGGSYPNYPDATLADWATAYYGANLPRLLDIKSHYDPNGLFRFDQGLAF